MRERKEEQGEHEDKKMSERPDLGNLFVFNPLQIKSYRGLNINCHRDTGIVLESLIPTLSISILSRQSCTSEDSLLHLSLELGLSQGQFQGVASQGARKT